MAWKLLLRDAHGRSPDREVHALQVRFVGDTAEIHRTDGAIELVSMNDFQMTTWTRAELWAELRKLGGGKLWFERKGASQPASKRA